MDSSVAAHLLLRRGYEVMGVHMSNWDGSDERGHSACPETEDAKDAQVKNLHRFEAGCCPTSFGPLG